jgi:hypothetical protein
MVIAILGILAFCVVGLWVLWLEIECVEDKKKEIT